MQYRKNCGVYKDNFLKGRSIMSLENYYPFSAAALPYCIDALEPYISGYTMYFHHDKHYKNYLDKLNHLVEGSPLMQNIPLEGLTKMGNDDVSRNAGGVYNHELYFNSLTPNYKEPSGNMRNLINRSFGSEKEFRDELIDMGTNHNGSGWIWLVMDPTENMELIITSNQETIDFDKYLSLMTIDVWEHAYYLDKQNRRRDYLNDVMKVIDWEKVENRLNGEE